MTACPTIESLKAERTAIRERLAAIEEPRAKLGEADNAVEAARNELQTFADRHGRLVDEWASNGCRGTRPEPRAGLHAALEGTLQKARHAVLHNRTALATLDAREAESRRELAGIEQLIQNAAVRIMGASLSALAEEVISLREETTAAEYRIQAGYDFIRGLPGGVEAAAGVRKAIEIGPFNAGLQAPRPAQNGAAISLAQAAIPHAPIDPVRHQYWDRIIKAEFGNLVSGEV